MTEPGSKDNRDCAPSIRLVALTGFMGSGKTTTGRELASLLAWQFVDLDEVIERQEHVAIRELFRDRGEVAFRAIEHAALELCLTQCATPTILALGGGAFVQPENAELLRQNRVPTVFLELPVEDMLRRCDCEETPEPQKLRPLAVNPLSFRKLYQQRLPSYRKADLTVNTHGKTAAEAAGEIAALLHLTTIP